MTRALFSMALAAAALASAFIGFEKGRLSSREIPLIAILAALAALGRIPFAGVPGLQPTTFIVAASGVVFGPAIGYLVGAFAALASNIFLGHGPWTFWQMLAWGACGASAGAMGRLMPRAGRIALAIFTAAWGYLFGWIMDLWFWYSFVHPISLASWIAVGAASFPADTVHAAGNACFSLLLGNGLMRALRYSKKRLALSSMACYIRASEPRR
jgi:energy-coupling factor transport system substrate-specific component